MVTRELPLWGTGGGPTRTVGISNGYTQKYIHHGRRDVDQLVGFLLRLDSGFHGRDKRGACLIGTAILIATGIGSWRIMAGCYIGALGFSSILYLIPSESNAMLGIAWWHFVIGGFAFGTVFMATDPVSASMTETGKWIYGVLVGIMTILVRSLNPAFPEGIMLAILFGNAFAPLIDYCVVQANIKRRAVRYAS